MTWEKAKLGEICTIEKGNIGIMKAIPGEYPLVVLGEERKSHNEFQFDDEAVIIPLVSSTGHGHRSMKRIFLQKGKFSVGSILCAVIPKDKSKVSAEFLYRYLDFNKEKELVSRMKGMANVTLPMKEIATVEIPLPPIEHQKKLIEEFQKLETANNQITAELSQQLELVRQLRQAFLREAMQGKLVPQDEQDEPAEILLEKIKAEKEKLVAEKKIKKEKPLPEIKPEEIPFEIPSNWTWCRLGYVGICQTGTTPPTAEKDNFGNFIPFVKPADISLKKINYKNEGLSEKGLTKGVLIPKGSLLMVCIGGSIGKSNYNVIDVSCNQQINTITPLAEIKSQFLQFLLQSDYFQTAIWSKASGGTTPIVNRSKWESIPIPLPPLAEQKRIVEKLEKLMNFCDELEANIRESKTNAETLLQVALKEALEPKDKLQGEL